MLQAQGAGPGSPCAWPCCSNCCHAHLIAVSPRPLKPGAGRRGLHSIYMDGRPARLYCVECTASLAKGDRPCACAARCVCQEGEPHHSHHSWEPAPSPKFGPPTRRPGDRDRTARPLLFSVRPAAARLLHLLIPDPNSHLQPYIPSPATYTPIQQHHISSFPLNKAPQ